MQVTGPTPVAFVAPSATLVVNSIAFDMNAQVYTVSFADPANAVPRVATGPIPQNVLTALQALVQGAVETAVNWAPGSSTVPAAKAQGT